MGNDWLNLEVEQFGIPPVTVWLDIKLTLNKFMTVSFTWQGLWVTKEMLNTKFTKKDDQQSKLPVPAKIVCLTKLL